MSLVWNFLDGGCSMPNNKTFGQRLTLSAGRWLATRHAHVELAPDARVHPDARIHPRNGTIRLGPRCAVAAGAVLQGNIKMGENCSIQAYTILVGYGTRGNPIGTITVGNNVRIAPYVMMIAANHVFADPSRLITEQGLDAGSITIEDDVWVAGRVSIMAGVTIGKGAVIGAGAVVTRDVPAYGIAVGVPAKVISSRLKSSPMPAPLESDLE